MQQQHTPPPAHTNPERMVLLARDANEYHQARLFIDSKQKEGSKTQYDIDSFWDYHTPEEVEFLPTVAAVQMDISADKEAAPASIPPVVEEKKKPGPKPKTQPFVPPKASVEQLPEGDRSLNKRFTEEDEIQRYWRADPKSLVHPKVFDSTLTGEYNITQAKKHTSGAFERGEQPPLLRKNLLFTVEQEFLRHRPLEMVLDHVAEEKLELRRRGVQYASTERKRYWNEMMHRGSYVDQQAKYAALEADIEFVNRHSAMKRALFAPMEQLLAMHRRLEQVEDALVGGGQARPAPNTFMRARGLGDRTMLSRLQDVEESTSSFIEDVNKQLADARALEEQRWEQLQRQVLALKQQQLPLPALETFPATPLPAPSPAPAEEQSAAATVKRELKAGVTGKRKPGLQCPHPGCNKVLAGDKCNVRDHWKSMHQQKEGMDLDAFLSRPIVVKSEAVKSTTTRSAETYPCAVCQAELPTKESLYQHHAMFHPTVPTPLQQRRLDAERQKETKHEVIACTYPGCNLKLEWFPSAARRLLQFHVDTYHKTERAEAAIKTILTESGDQDDTI